MASPFVMQISAHMSALEDAMRVVSLKPPPISFMQDSRSLPLRFKRVTKAAEKATDALKEGFEEIKEKVFGKKEAE